MSNPGITVEGQYVGRFTSPEEPFLIAIDNPDKETVASVSYGDKVYRVRLVVLDRRTTKIVKSINDEWVVKLYIDGVYQKYSNYFTNDHEDAVQTAKHLESGL